MGRRKLERVEVTCKICGKTFLDRLSRKRVYCSRECDGKAAAKRYEAARKTVVCEVCGKVSRVRPGIMGRFCSRACANPVISVETATKRGDRLRKPGGRSKYTKLGGRHMHRVVAEQAIGRPLEPGEVVHHIDENTHNNSPENLQVLPSQSEHVKLHFGKGRSGDVERD